MNLQTILKQVREAKCPEDVFGSEDIQKRFRDLSKLTHPDLHPSKKEQPLAEEAFKLLGEWLIKAERKVKNGTYGDKTALDSPIIIKTKREVYTITERLASGDLCEVYGAGKTILKVPRSPANNDLMQVEGERLQWFKEEAPTRKLKVMAHIPVFKDSFDLKQGPQKKRINVIEKGEGFYTLQEVMNAHGPLDIRDAAWMFNRLLAALMVSQQAGVVHGAIIPTNFLIRPEDHHGLLIDWCYSVKAGEVIKAIVPSYKAFYPTEVLAKSKAGPATDIYMAAICFLALLDGDVEKKTFPRIIGMPFQGLIKACLLGPKHRINDVFELHKEFNDLLKNIFGKKTFRVFTMPGTTKNKTT